MEKSEALYLNGADLITAERRRQVEKEGWSAEHDGEHEPDTLAYAALCYLLPAAVRKFELASKSFFEWFWPFEMKYWKPTPEDRVKELVKAGALIAAEIDRIQRQKQTSKESA
ncbi:hypothetical protein [Anaeromusa acidaminophila]|uniref:hypothetical protein n=1 Tax=Anaeromusa acidaminophila TaxID=81464 RepID=UPI000366623D|nr:hypothetical protein [Anaeromusa acidaminophila]